MNDSAPPQPPRKRGRPKGSTKKAALAAAPSNSPPAGRGRPTKLTKAVQAAFCVHLSRGVWIERAAALVGLDKTAVYEWLKKGATEASGPHRDFANAVEAAHAKAEEALAGVVFDAGAAGDWKAALAVLERKFPTQWGKRQLIAVEAVKSEAKETPFAFRVVGDEVHALPAGETQGPEPADAPDPEDPPPDAAA